MSFISKTRESRKSILIIFGIGIFGVFILVFIGHCIEFHSLYMEVDRLTNPNYFPPEVEMQLLAEINVSNSEVLSVEHIKDVIEAAAEENIELVYESGRKINDYERMPDSLRLLMEEFISGFLIRKNSEAEHEMIPELTKEDLIEEFTFHVTKKGVVFSLNLYYLNYLYTYYPDGVIQKEIICSFTRGLDTIEHYIDNEQIGIQKTYETFSYHMINTGEKIMKNINYESSRKKYKDSLGEQISLKDYNNFRSDYLSGKVPVDFLVTIESIHNYMGKRN